MLKSGTVIWFCGRSGSGKTTLMNALRAILLHNSLPLVSIDGDEARAFTQGALGYTQQDRETNLRYLAFAAAKAAESGATVLVASLSPYEKIRRWTRSVIPNYYEVYVDCPLEVCMQRDPKGHYAKMRDGKMKNFVGIDMPYDVPEKPDYVVDTSQSSVEETLDELLSGIGTELVPLLHKKVS